MCHESRAIALASNKLGFLSPDKNAHYLTPSNVTLLFSDLDALASYCGGKSIEGRAHSGLLRAFEDTFLVLAVDPQYPIIGSYRNERERANIINFVLRILLGAIKHTRGLRVEEMILFCEKEDMALFPSVEKALKEQWDKENRMHEQFLSVNSLSGSVWDIIGWRVPKLTGLMYKLKDPLPRTLIRFATIFLSRETFSRDSRFFEVIRRGYQGSRQGQFTKDDLAVFKQRT